MFVVRLALFIASIVANIFTMIRKCLSLFYPFHDSYRCKQIFWLIV